MTAIIALGFAGGACSSAGAPSSQIPTRLLSSELKRNAVVEAMTMVAEWQLANPSSHPTYEWHQAPFWAGLVAFAPLSRNPQKYLQAVRANGERNNWQPGPRPLLADDHAILQSYMLLYEHERDPRMIAPALQRFDSMLVLPFDESLEFAEGKWNREWMWADALFMSPPALALATRVTGDLRYADLMNRLWWKTTDYLYDKEEHLFYRDSRFFDVREANNSKVFWSRGNGWVFAGLARVLQYLPADYPERPRYVALFQDMAQKIASVQLPDGYWRPSLLDPQSMPIPETSGTGFFIYGLAWGINAGLLDRATYQPVVGRGWSALVHAVRPNGMLGYVQRVADRPGATTAESTEIYAVGAFLLAGAEVFRLSD